MAEQKNVTTLVPDLYDLLKKEVPLTEDQAKEIGEEMTKVLVQRLAMKDKKRSGISMSSFGEKCLRKLWFREHHPELAEAMPPNTVLKMLYGALLEPLLLGLIKATQHKVTGEQTAMSFAGISGSRDAVIDGLTIDVKSANSRSFDKFKNHRLQTEDPFNYLDQISLYTKAAENDEEVTIKNSAGFLAIDQELGHVVLDVYPIKKINYEEVAKTKLEAVNNPDVMPARGYLPVPDGYSGNEVLCTNCKYCDYKEACWKDANDGRGLAKFIFSSGPRWFTRIIRNPNPKVSQDV